MPDEKDEKFIMKMIRLILKHWWKILIVAVITGFLLSSCEIPTPWGVWKKGGIDMPWSK